MPFIMYIMKIAIYLILDILMGEMMGEIDVFSSCLIFGHIPTACVCTHVGELDLGESWEGCTCPVSSVSSWTEN